MICQLPPLFPDGRQVERPPPLLQITSNFLVFYGLSHDITLEKKCVAQNLIYSKIWWTISWNCWVLSLVENLFLQKNPLQDFLSNLNAVISTNESTEFITGHVRRTWRRNCTILLPKTGGRAGPIWSCPKKVPHPSFQEWYHVKAHKKLENLM